MTIEELNLLGKLQEITNSLDEVFIKGSTIILNVEITKNPQKEDNEQLTEFLNSSINLFNTKYNEISHKDIIPIKIKEIAHDIQRLSSKNLTQLTFYDIRDLFYDVIMKKNNIDVIIYKLLSGPSLI
ncbi:MAG: hypothetical protein K8S23_15215 [Candidatus Cloacimonetes bacterium]|nr:hypothetical protein [Candidatus Cloacimonadota bacterium]